jgi:hypothetical protein
MQKSIMDALQRSSVPVSTADLRENYEFEIRHPDSDHITYLDSDSDPITPARRRSVRMSMGRALRQLQAAGQIKRTGAGNWYPSKDWVARDNAKLERSGTAYHEAGHVPWSASR